MRDLPRSTVVHRELPCPWALKGLVMRVLNERFADRDVDVTDGIKVIDERGWVQVLPDPDEPIVHLYAEGDTEEDSLELEARAPRGGGGDRAGERRGANHGLSRLSTRG